MKQTKGNGINGLVRWLVGLCRSLLADFRPGAYICRSVQLMRLVYAVFVFLSVKMGSAGKAKVVIEGMEYR
ncbi:hypothetical protein [uncultured Sunxiuqinia sp.]|uniref:hypothetical protein n=1 Tax=uncultured Sunxiuqinia sp. TaxID=1573825 RepID=UPI00262CB3F0|nr:hypothetical protein [uncultured Sunxiuqinia sp.]